MASGEIAPTVTLLKPHNQLTYSLSIHSLPVNRNSRSRAIIYVSLYLYSILFNIMMKNCTKYPWNFQDIGKILYHRDSLYSTSDCVNN